MRLSGWLSSTTIAAVASVVASLAFMGSVTAGPSDKEVDDAMSAFHKAYASKDENDRLQAVEAVASVQHKRVVEALGTALTKDSVAAVKRAAAKGLGGQWSLTSVPALAKGLNLADDKAKDVNVAIIAALGETNSDAAVPILTSILVPHRQARGGRGNAAPAPQPEASDGSAYDLPALQALAKIASPAAMNDVMDFLAKQGAGAGRKGRGGNSGGNTDPIAAEAERVLEGITGTKQSGILAWRKWWADNQPKVKVIQVQRCEQTGDVWEKSATVTKCPTDGDKNSHCSVFLKSKLEGGGHAPAASSDHKSGGGRGGKGKGGSNGGE